MSRRPIRLVIADGQRLFREGLARLLDGRDEFRVEAAVDTGAEAAERALVLRPDVLLTELFPPGLEGVEATRRIRDSGVSTQVVIVTQHDDEVYRRRGFETGARGWVSKACGFEDVAEAIRRVCGGDCFLAGPCGREAAGGYAELLARGQRPGGIMTPRERQVAALLADGYSTKEVADVLGISVRTAEAHRAAVSQKLGARNLADIVKYCIRNRLIGL